MSRALYWMPQCDVSPFPEAFRAWYGHRFLAAHGQRGHILTPSAEAWSSSETLVPIKGQVWYVRQWQKVTARSKPRAVTVEIPVPQGVTDPGLALLSRAQESYPLNRIVLTRPQNLTLDRMETSIATLLESLSAIVWLDGESFGADAASYLLVKYPSLQVSRVSEEWLGRIGEIADRPLYLFDYSEAAPVPIPRPPHFPVLDDEPSGAYMLPPGWRTR